MSTVLITIQAGAAMEKFAALLRLAAAEAEVVCEYFSLLKIKKQNQGLGELEATANNQQITTLIG